MRLINSIFNRNSKALAFQRAFSPLNRMGERVISAKLTYDLLKGLNFETSEFTSEKLIEEFSRIKYASNTNSYFYFYFPIVSHILYYKPQYEKQLLRYLIGPNFANGTTETAEMISIITGAMNFKLKENKYFITSEGKEWVINELPKLEKQVDREIQICWKELND